MKKILASLAVIALVSSTGVGATRAYFTDTENINNMTFETGTIKLSNASESWMTHVSFTNLKPGDSVRKWVVLQNDGSLDIASLKVSFKNLTTGNALLSNIKVSLVGQVEGFDNAYYTPDWTTGAVVTDLTTPVDILGSYFYTGGAPANVLPPTKKDTVIIDFTVPTTLDNSFQGLSGSFDMQFDAEQSHVGVDYF